jgi:ankyrin repeat protein
MLSVSLVEELEKKQPVMSYFCTNEDERRSNASVVLRSLLWQMTSIHPDLAHNLLRHLGAEESDSPGRMQASLSSVETLWITFSTICRDPRISRLSFVLDGLDECDQDSRDWLASKLYGLDAESGAQNIHPPKIIIVSRYIQRLRMCDKIQLDPDLDGKISRDVESFISARVQELWTRGDFDEKYRPQVERTLLDRSEGTFLWVGFAIAELLKKQTVFEVEQCLDDLPVGLPALYGRMFRHIAPQDTEKVAQLLKWTILSARPLSLLELAIVIPCKATRLRSAEEVVRDLVTLCQPFLKIQPKAESGEMAPTWQVLAELGRSSTQKDRSIDGEQTVNLVHQSARDFTGSCEMPTALQFQREKAHFEIAWKCMDILQSRGRAEHGFTMLAYARDQWPTHARKASLMVKPLLEHPSGFFGKSSEVRRWWWHEWWPQAISDRDARLVSPTNIDGLHLPAYFGIVPWIELVLSRQRWWKPDVKTGVNNEDLLFGRTPIFFAGTKGHDVAMRVLFKHGAKAHHIQYWSGYEPPAAHAFALSGNEMAVRICLEHEPILLAAGWETPLRLAATYGHVGVVELLLRAGADTNRDTALGHAAVNGHSATVRTLLDYGAEVDTEDHTGRSLLHLAAAAGHEHVVKMLSDHGASFDRVTALCFAASQGNEAEVRLQLSGGSPVDAQNSKGMTALYCAALGGHNAVVQVLVDWGADVAAIVTGPNRRFDWDIRPDDGTSVMHVVFSIFREEERFGLVVQVCCDLGVDINTSDGNGNTVLHRAVYFKQERSGKRITDFEQSAEQSASQFSLVQLLLNHGAKVDAENRGGITPLYYAVCEVSGYLVQHLLDHGARTSARDRKGETPLHRAGYYGSKGSIRVLLDHGAQIDAKDEHGRTPLHLAAGHPYFNIDRIVPLLDHSADVNARDNKGLTPLHVAARNYFYLDRRQVRSNEDAIVLLLDHGADINACDNKGLTPLDVAHICNVQMLEARGAVKGCRSGVLGSLKRFVGF